MSSGYEFTTREELNTAVDLWISYEPAANATYGDINTWDVNAITDFSNLFEDKTAWLHLFFSIILGVFRKV